MSRPAAGTISREAPIPWAGCIGPEADGLVITLRQGDTRGKKRFTAFHEVEHTFLPGFTPMVAQFRCTPGASQQKRLRDDVEGLCDIGAAELLLPRKHFFGDLAGNRATFDLVEQLAARYDASLEAVARRVVDLRGEPTMLFSAEPACKPSEPFAEPVLRIQWTFSKGLWPYIPRHKSVPTDCILHAALAGNPVEDTTALAGLCKAPMGWTHISARLYPYTDEQGEIHMRVLAMLTPMPASRTRHAG